MWAILLLFGCFAQICDPALAPQYDLNPECNFVGICIAIGGAPACYCCHVTDDRETSYDNCPKVLGTFSGVNCKSIEYFLSTKFGLIVVGDGVECADDGVASSEPNLLSEVQTMFANYPGQILSLPCQICTESNPCDLGDNEEETAETGIYVRFGTDLNTYYDLGCAVDSPLPESNPRACAENNDFGITARWAISDEVERAGVLTNLSEATNTNVVSYGKEEISTEVTRTFTSPLTLAPTGSPVEIEVKEISPCAKFSNSVSDIHFLEVGSSCRANINETWPGGRTCESPYIVCLPEENTPAGEFLGRKYYNISHRYSVDECKEECALDQRCLGFEFVPDMNSSLGDCNLIDDIPIGVINVSYVYAYNSEDENLYELLEGNNALCFEKRDYCNPHFTSEDLNETMLACYCPNNRKGSYTKKVKRTVNNTRFCGDDPSMDERIRYAQANRMFHLCENWCLFNALNPELESWYWDPWKSCWRETYSADGVHRGYCDRVIRNPDSIELKFVNERSSNLLSCSVSRTPTEAPVDDGNTTYFLGEELESCDDACARNNLTCAADQTARRFLNETELLEAFSEAGHTCDVERLTMNDTRYQGWALPGLRRGRFCTNRQQTLSHLEDLDSDCHRVIGENWQRLCACYLLSPIDY